MFKAIKAMFLFLVFFSYNVNAQLFSAYTYEDSSCYCQGAESSKSSFESDIKRAQSNLKKSLIDKYAEPLRFGFGRFKNQCVDNCRYRPVTQIQSPSDDFIFSDQVEIANIFHKGQFYKAKINFKMLDLAFAGFEEFAPGVFHFYLEFKSSDNEHKFLLTPQSEVLTPLRPVQSDSIIISAEGIPPLGSSYTLLDGYQSNYLLGVLSYSGEEMRERSALRLHPLKSVQLNISPKQIKSIFLDALKTSSTQKLNAVYQLFSKNCSTTSVGFLKSNLDLETKVRDSIWNKLQIALPIAGPFSTLTALKSLGLVKPNPLGATN